MFNLQYFQPTVVVAALALIVSTISLCVSFSSFLRDRARRRVKSVFHEPSEYGNGCIHLTIMNAGRRPIILRLLGDEGGDNWVGTFFGDHERGLRLGKHERHELNIRSEDLVQTTAYDEITVTTIWIEDSLGRR
jgi:hypothetical protein